MTRLKRAEEALRASEERYGALFNSIDEGFCVIEMFFDKNEKPVDYRFLEVSPSFEKQTGLKDAQGKSMRELAPDHEQHWFDIYGKIAVTGVPVRFQNRAEQLHRWYDVYAFRFGAEEKRQVGILFNDITERKRIEEHRDLLLRDANHRVKNALTTVQAIASQTLRHSTTLEDFRLAFQGRLSALARVHDLLVNENAQGADIAQLLRQTLAPHGAGDGGHITIDGPPQTVPRLSGTSLLLIFHELATNAAKHGALSVGGGRLTVTWELEEGGPGAPRQIHLRWVESDGPRATAPAHRGFGTTLIERVTAQELGGTANLDFRETGLHCELIFPLQFNRDTPE